MATVNGVQLLRIASNCRIECSTGSVEPSSYAATFYSTAVVNFQVSTQKS